MLMNCLLRNADWYFAIYSISKLFLSSPLTYPYDVQLLQTALKLRLRRTHENLVVAYHSRPEGQHAFRSPDGVSLAQQTCTHPRRNWRADGTSPDFRLLFMLRAACFITSIPATPQPSVKQ